MLTSSASTYKINFFIMFCKIHNCPLSIIAWFCHFWLRKYINYIKNTKCHSVSILGPILEITKQDFFQDAKTLIAQHYERINEVNALHLSNSIFFRGLISISVHYKDCFKWLHELLQILSKKDKMKG